MKSAVLLPYCPLPAATGSRKEMFKHLESLLEVGECVILSSSVKPVGCGWTGERRSDMEARGFKILLREEECRRSLVQMAGIGYAACFKAFGLDKAFGHSNPYHRYAFPSDWWKKHTAEADLAVINYSYFAWLPCGCPKVVVLHDLLSDYMWGGVSREIEDLEKADLVVVISKDEEEKLNELGVRKTLWSPPAVTSSDLPLTTAVGLIGSANEFNIEGLRWLERGRVGVSVRVYGDLGGKVSVAAFESKGRYADPMLPYRDCGIILLPTVGGTGVQIKAVEALAYGRAIVVRKGAMRGLPEGKGAWIEVEKPEDMVEAAQDLRSNDKARLQLSTAARAYYTRYLDSSAIRKNLIEAYTRLAGRDRTRVA